MFGAESLQSIMASQVIQMESFMRGHAASTFRANPQRSALDHLWLVDNVSLHHARLQGMS